MVKDSGVNSMILTYEQVTDPSFNFTDVWNFLGVKDVGNTKPITKKLIKSYDHIKNLQEIREKLNSEENGMV